MKIIVKLSSYSLVICQPTVRQHTERLNLKSRTAPELETVIRLSNGLDLSNSVYIFFENQYAGILQYHKIAPNVFSMLILQN